MSDEWTVHRSRNRLAADELCYLCGKPMQPGEWDRDHLPPKRIFASAVRRQFSPQLEWLPTHIGCNRAYRDDEAYFIVSFVGHVSTPTARAVMNDLRQAALRGYERGLIRDVIGRFGQVTGSRGEVLFSYDHERTNRFIWKLVRGFYYLYLLRVLPESMMGQIVVVSATDPPHDLKRINWFSAVRDTESLAKYGRVFDYKWLCWKDGELRGHAFSMLFWDGLIAAALFHDPTCRCGTCPGVE